MRVINVFSLALVVGVSTSQALVPPPHEPIPVSSSTELPFSHRIPTHTFHHPPVPTGDQNSTQYGSSSSGSPFHVTWPLPEPVFDTNVFPTASGILTSKFPQLPHTNGIADLPGEGSPLRPTSISKSLTSHTHRGGDFPTYNPLHNPQHPTSVSTGLVTAHSASVQLRDSAAKQTYHMDCSGSDMNSVEAVDVCPGYDYVMAINGNDCAKWCFCNNYGQLECPAPIGCVDIQAFSETCKKGNTWTCTCKPIVEDLPANAVVRGLDTTHTHASSYDHTHAHVHTHTHAATHTNTHNHTHPHPHTHSHSTSSTPTHTAMMQMHDVEENPTYYLDCSGSDMDITSVVEPCSNSEFILPINGRDCSNWCSCDNDGKLNCPSPAQGCKDIGAVTYACKQSVNFTCTCNKIKDIVPAIAASDFQQPSTMKTVQVPKSSTAFEKKSISKDFTFTCDGDLLKSFPTDKCPSPSLSIWLNGYYCKAHCTCNNKGCIICDAEGSPSGIDDCGGNDAVTNFCKSDGHWNLSCYCKNKHGAKSGCD